jgi:hypothetical protein
LQQRATDAVTAEARQHRELVKPGLAVERPQQREADRPVGAIGRDPTRLKTSLPRGVKSKVGKRLKSPFVRFY